MELLADDTIMGRVVHSHGEMVNYCQDHPIEMWVIWRRETHSTLELHEL